MNAIASASTRPAGILGTRSVLLQKAGRSRVLSAPHSGVRTAPVRGLTTVAALDLESAVSSAAPSSSPQLVADVAASWVDGVKAIPDLVSINSTDDVLGVSFFLGACAFSYWLVWAGKKKIKETKEWLEARGIPTKGIDRVGPLSMLKRTIEEGGDPDLAMEVATGMVAIYEIQYGGAGSLKKWQDYYEEKGIRLKTAGDGRKLEAYLQGLYAQAQESIKKGGEKETEDSKDGEGKAE